jgi:hypothetical protein
VKTCSVCGQPTKSKYEVCNRANKACRSAYLKLWSKDQDKAQRNEVARRYRQKQKKSNSVYAVHFPGSSILKVGLTAFTSPAIYVGTARQGALKRGWEIRDSSCIWRHPGDVRVEAWMQASLSFRWPGAFGKRQNRICEWFDVAGLPLDAINAALDDVYQSVPIDLVGAPKDLVAVP